MRKPCPLAALPLVSALLVWLGPPPLQAATYYVTVDDSGFSPMTQTIGAGDTVVWANLDDTFSHTTTSDLPVTNPNYWDGVLIDFLDTFSQQFNNVGTFTYHDQLDVGTGTIIVSGGNTAPSVNITSPLPDAVFAAPAAFTIEAAASDPDAGGSVLAVEFFVGDTSVGVDFDLPYSAPVNGLGAGVHTLSAIATDNVGAQSTNSIRITVSGLGVSLGSPRLVSGQFLFEATGLTVSRTNVLQGSIDLAGWSSIQTNVAAGTAATFTNATSSGQRFYRLLELVQ